MKRRQKLWCTMIASVATAGVLLMGCGGGQTASDSGSATTNAPNSENPIELKLCNLFDEGHPVTNQAETFAETIEKETDGAIKIKIYNNSTLAEPVQAFEETSRGTIDIDLNQPYSTYGNFFEVIQWPYLASNYEEAEQVYGNDSWLHNKFEEMCAEHNIKFLAFQLVGFNGMGFAERPDNYNVPGADKGILLRCPPIEVTDTWATDMGFRTTSIAYSDLYTALQTGACDGWTGGQPTVNYQSFRDVIHYYCQYNSGFEVNCLAMNNDVWESLSDEQKEIVQKAADDLFTQSLEDIKVDTQHYIDEMRDFGIEILELSDEEVEAFAKYTRETTYPKYKELIGEEAYNELMEGLGLAE